MADDAAPDAAGGVKKKAAISAFFAKSKAKSKPAPDVPAAAAATAPPSGAAGPTSSSSAQSAGQSNTWVEVAEERHRDPALLAQLGTRVGDLTDEDLLNSGGVDVEAEAARKAFWAARKAPKKKASSKAEGPPAPVITGWRAKLEARKTTGGKVDINNSVLFPTLERAASGFHPAAIFGDPSAHDILSIGRPSAWAALALDDSEDEAEEEAAAAASATREVPAPEKAAAPRAGKSGSAPAAAAASSSSSSAGVAAAAAAPASAPANVALTPEELTPADASTPALDSPAAVTEAAAAIIQALRSSKDVDAAVAAVGRSHAAPLDLRAGFVEALLQAGLDAETAEDRRAAGRVLCGLLPARAVTPLMLTQALVGVLEVYDDIAVDIPKAAQYFAELLDGVVEGSPQALAAAGGAPSHLVPAWVLPAPVADALHIAPGLRVRRSEAELAAAAAAASPAAISVAASAAGVAASQTTAGDGPAAAAASAPAPAAADSAAASSAAADAGGAAADGEVDDLFASAKRKKKTKKTGDAAAPAAE